jgi:ABC-type multidrug transport system permease subunit
MTKEALGWVLMAGWGLGVLRTGMLEGAWWRTGSNALHVIIFFQVLVRTLYHNNGSYVIVQAGTVHCTY